MKTIGPNVAVVLSGVTLATGLAAAVLGVGFTVAPAQVAAQQAPAVVLTAPAAPSAVPVARKPAKPTHTTRTRTTEPTTTTPSGVDYGKCTNRINYGSDPRSNATINSIGEQTGTCPKPLTSRTGGTGGAKGAGSTGTCMDTGTCYDPAGSAPGEGLSDVDFHSMTDVNGETFYDYCARTGQPVSTCAAG